MRPRFIPFSLLSLVTAGSAIPSAAQVDVPDLPDTSLALTYERAAVQNVLAAVNPDLFPGYFSVYADGHGAGFGNTYPSLDGHQMTDALLWLGKVSVVEENWEYVKWFQRKNGLLPIAILPASAGKDIGPKGFPAMVSPNGGLYVHWVPGNPLEALGSPTYIQNADVIFRSTLDTTWLLAQLPSVNLAADFLGSLTSDSGAVRGGGYYVERPTRLESDGVAQCFAVDAFRKAAALNRIAGNDSAAGRFEILAERIRNHFVTRFWVGDHFAEYINPVHGIVAGHGLTDVDWASIATGLATPQQQLMLWPKLRSEHRFRYGGVPTGIAAHPERYEPWEFNYPDSHDLAAMGRVWYLEAWARARMGNAAGLLEGLRTVSRIGRDSGYYWHERYEPDRKGGAVATGPNKYCEYPANYIRIMQRFLLGVELRLDGSIALEPTVTDEFWDRGFGQTLKFRGRTLRYRMTRDGLSGAYTGPASQRLYMTVPAGSPNFVLRTTTNGRYVQTGLSARADPVHPDRQSLDVTIPAARGDEPSAFSVERLAGRVGPVR